ncbi:hypothetical protein A3A38_02745 [Candidatus Kaiserbacteria bacterium RIFCSPLOWO2_01_FULL_53_17]|uniref:DNA-damage-inducible protein J n=1 Tax=Candidatus Kaiserbacteria bacterium RIFCSPLOWO2_01_FULL_53_17 TaxID=1798511 RepID=A0A1F6EH08_9BACT|nr:MAG: hypothetical protein A3A38_02745 [Candidatus Kaiserbacteria bacterium RIFCSPLOWO2_01_FULL_53_17]
MANDTTMVHVRVSKKVSKEAQKVARSLGVPLSLVAEQAFKRFAAERQLIVEESFTPTPYLEKILREAEKNKNNPKYWSGPFNGKDFIQHLRDLSQSAQ